MIMNTITWDKLQVKQKVSIFAAGILLCCYVFYTIILVPQRDHINELTAQYDAEQQKVKVIEDFVKPHPNPEQYLVELDHQMLQIDKMLPDNLEMSSFLMQADRLAQESGVQLNYVKPTKAANKEGYREIEIELSATGRFPQIMNFLYKIENGTRFINVTNITVQANKEGLNSKITAKVYSYGVSAAPPIVNPNTNTGTNTNKPPEAKK